MNSSFVEPFLDASKKVELFRRSGRVLKSVGLISEAYLPGASIGSICKVYADGDFEGLHAIEAEVVGFRDDRVLLMPFETVQNISTGSHVVLFRSTEDVWVSGSVLGRVLDASGAPMDELGEIRHDNDAEKRKLYGAPTHPLTRDLVREPLDLGVKSINGLLTCGKGQRVGIMAGSGVGKSVLLGMMARNTQADVNVIALIGERGREVKEFIERDLGPEGLARSIVIVATSD